MEAKKKNQSQNRKPKPRVDACMDAEWRGYTAAALSLHGLTRGAPVLKWAAERLRADKALVCFLAWSNPTNLCFASPALQADAEVVAAALASPFYAEPPPPEPPSCVLRSAAEDLRASRETVLAALARSGYEFEFAGDALRADAYVAAWAGAPVGAARARQLSTTFVRLLGSGVSVEYMDAHWKTIMQDDDSKGSINKDYLAGWSKIPADQHDYQTLAQWRKDNGYRIGCGGIFKNDICAELKKRLDARCPLCLRVAPPVRDVLWPTREDWDGVF